MKKNKKVFEKGNGNSFSIIFKFFSILDQLNVKTQNGLKDLCPLNEKTENSLFEYIYT